MQCTLFSHQICWKTDRCSISNLLLSSLERPPSLSRCHRSWTFTSPAHEGRKHKHAESQLHIKSDKHKHAVVLTILTVKPPLVSVFFPSFFRFSLLFAGGAMYCIKSDEAMICRLTRRALTYLGFNHQRLARGAELAWSTCSVEMNGGKFLGRRNGFEETSIGLHGMAMTSNGSPPLAKQSIGSI